jgi:hypothetical protein
VSAPISMARVAAASIYLAAHTPTPRLLAGDPDPTIFAFEEDPIMEAMEWASMNRLSVTQDADEQHEAVLVLMTDGWRKSPQVTRAVLRAQRIKLPVYFIVPGSLRLLRAS